MKLNDDTYYGKEANQAFFSVSQYKDFCKCEAMAMAKIRGEFEQKQTKAMLIGTLVDRWFEGTLDKLREESPNIFYCRNGALRAEFRKADEIIKRVQRDERFMLYMSGEKQKILTFEMFGAPWKMKMDSFVEGICITDLKVVQNFKSLAFWRYDLQGAVYRAGVEACGYGRLPFYLAAAAKEAVTNFDIFQIDQPTLDMALREIESNMPRFKAVKSGEEPPKHCGICDYCKSVKKARIRNYWRDRKMKTLKFHGYSDDTFGEYGVTNQDCDNCSNGKPIQCIVDCGERGRVFVVGQYSNVSMGSGCWLVGMTKVSEYEELPDWNFRYEESDCEYSPALLMDLPEGDFNLEWFIDGKKVER